MTAVAERPAPPAPGQVTAAGKPAGRRIDAVTILTIWVVLLMAIPASLVVAPLGAVGGPATIFAAVVLVFYLVTCCTRGWRRRRAASRSVPRRSCLRAP